MKSRPVLVLFLVVACACGAGSCAKSPPPTTVGGGGADGGGNPVPGTIAISAAKRTARTNGVGLNYWMWAPTYGDNVAGTEALALALAPRFLRVGGHNNDNNVPDPFDDAQLDRAVAYARAIGAEPIVQVPLLADQMGAPPTAVQAAAIVASANGTKGHGIKYFSIGNEPDLYPDQEASKPGYTAADYCTSARAFVTAMKAADPSILFVGPDLSWKYQGGTDWMTPILTMCGDLFDIVSFHRYPFGPGASTAAAAQGDAAQFRAVVASLRGIMRATGQSAKPLALTETNITYDGEPTKSTLDASPGTVPAGLWTADMLGTALSEGLWTTLLWSISEGWTLGLLTPGAHVARPAYHALALYAAHFGPTSIDVTATPAGVHAYASRDAADGKTQIILINWNIRPQALTFSITGTTAPVAGATFVVGARSFAAVELPDTGMAAAWTYGAEQWATQGSPATLAPTAPAP